MVKKWPEKMSKKWPEKIAEKMTRKMAKKWPLASLDVCPPNFQNSSKKIFNIFSE